MLQIVKTSPQTWTQSEGKIKFDAFELEVDSPELLKLSDFFKIPQTLNHFDLKVKTPLYLPVLRSFAPETLEFIFDDESGKFYSFLDPKSHFVTDSEYENLLESLLKLGLSPVSEERKDGLRRQFFAPIVSDFEFLGDAFSIRQSITRKPEGGIDFNSTLLRLICTNGAAVQDKAVKKSFRQLPKIEYVQRFIEGVVDFDYNQFLNQLFSFGGKKVQASVGNYFSMRNTLRTIVGAEVADEYFPSEIIENFYRNQGVDVTKTSITALNRIPAGISYFDAFNILTNAASHEADHLSVENQTKVGSFLSRKRIIENQFDLLSSKGAPQFSEKLLKTLKGDNRAHV